MKKRVWLKTLLPVGVLAAYGTLVMPHVSTRIAGALLQGLERPAYAQASNGPCRDPWLNELIPEAMTVFGYGNVKTPRIVGFDVQGDCNPLLYGNGRWAGKDDLRTKVTESFANRKMNNCRDAWINQAHSPNGLGYPSGQRENLDCNMYLFGGGKWSGQQDLNNKVKEFKDRLSAAEMGYDRQLGAFTVRVGLGKHLGFYKDPFYLAGIVEGDKVLAAGGRAVVAQGPANLAQLVAGSSKPVDVTAVGYGNVIAQKGNDFLAYKPSQGGSGALSILNLGNGVVLLMPRVPRVQ